MGTHLEPLAPPAMLLIQWPPSVLSKEKEFMPPQRIRPQTHRPALTYRLDNHTSVCIQSHTHADFSHLHAYDCRFSHLLLGTLICTFAHPHSHAEVLPSRAPGVGQGGGGERQEALILGGEVGVGAAPFRLSGLPEGAGAAEAGWGAWQARGFTPVGPQALHSMGWGWGAL